ncbi:MAG: right-handed parallel beta-helix repeat-containing protein [Acidobacteriia bacterium]|nr:right-handed parallel beta-helix repeat-containing protein [Terriglobia bacterium]
MYSRFAALILLLSLILLVSICSAQSVGGGGANCGTANADYYVATNGNDSWSGTLDAPNPSKTDGPFATLDGARKTVQGMPGGRHLVMIRNGNYYLSAPVIFTADDSGTSSTPILYENYPCEIPVISGGKKITGWTNVSGNTWTVPLSSSSYQNFENLFYNGTRRLRPRSTVGTYLHNVGPVYVNSQSDNCSLQVNGQWECFDRFVYANNDLASTYHSIALGDVEVLDFEKWTMSRMRLQSVDTSKHIAYLTGPTNQDLDNGFLPGHRYLLENVKESLTQPGQWYVDRCTNPPSCTSSSGTWTLTYLAQSGETPKNAEIIIPQQTQLIVATDLQYVTFQGITFSHDNWLPPAGGLADQQGAMGVPAALSFTGSSNVIFDGCTISHTQGWGVEFVGTGSVKNQISNQVVNSLLYDLGSGGVRIGMTPQTKRDTDADVAQYVLVQNNLITGGGRVQPTGIGTGVLVGNSHHNTITHNEISDFYNGAIGVGLVWGMSSGVTSYAHDNTISYNLLYNLGQGVTSDIGAIYLATSGTKGNQILNNVIHDVTHPILDADGFGGNGIYLDQGTSNVTVKNNLVYRTTSSSLFANLSDRKSDTYPQNNVADNNIFVEANLYSVNHGGQNPNSLTLTHNIFYYKIALQGGKWACFDVGGSGKPVPCNTRFVMDHNLYWMPNGSSLKFITTDPYVVPPRTSYTGLSAWQAVGEDAHSQNKDPLFVNPTYPTDNYNLQSGSPAFSLGFVSFDTTQAGRNAPVLTAPAVPIAFPQELKDPGSY